MNESIDQKNTDASVQPEEKTLYQQKLEKEHSKSISVQKGAGILVGLTSLLVIVIFILPLLLQEDKEDLSNQEIEEKPILIPNQDILAQKPIAEALLSELLMINQQILFPFSLEQQILIQLLKLLILF